MNTNLKANRCDQPQVDFSLRGEASACVSLSAIGGEGRGKGDWRTAVRDGAEVPSDHHLDLESGPAFHFHARPLTLPSPPMGEREITIVRRSPASFVSLRVH